MAAPEFVYTVYIAAPVERVWNALVDGDLTRQYWGHEIAPTGSPARAGSMSGSGRVARSTSPAR